MKISAKLDYACRAVLELAIHWPSPEVVSITLIAKRRKIPLKFLTQILLSLKQMGIVESVRGKSGGYVLTKSPHDIRLADLLRHFEGWGQNKSKSVNIVSNVWIELDEAILNFAGQITFEDLALKEKNKQGIAGYTI